MDNILKLLLGVLSVSGLIALVIPQSNPAPETQMRAVNDMPAMAQTTSIPQPAQAPPPEIFNSEPQGDFQIGAPSIDGNPMAPNFGMPYGTSAQTTSSNTDSVSSNTGGYTPQPYVMPGSTPPTESIPDAAGMASLQ